MGVHHHTWPVGWTQDSGVRTAWGTRYWTQVLELAGQVLRPLSYLSSPETYFCTTQLFDFYQHDLEVLHDCGVWSDSSRKDYSVATFNVNYPSSYFWIITQLNRTVSCITGKETPGWFQCCSVARLAVGIPRWVQHDPGWSQLAALVIAGSSLLAQW